MRGINILSLTFTAAAAITGQRFMKINGNPGTAGSAVAGVARFGGQAGDDITVDVLGTSQVEVGAAVAKGDELQSDGDARAVPNDGTGTTVARALSSADIPGHVVDVLLVSH